MCDFRVSFMIMIWTTFCIHQVLTYTHCVWTHNSHNSCIVMSKPTWHLHSIERRWQTRVGSLIQVHGLTILSYIHKMQIVYPYFLLICKYDVDDPKLNCKRTKKHTNILIFYIMKTQYKNNYSHNGG